MAELDPESVTLQDVLDNYNDDPDRLSKKTGKMPKKRSLGPLLKDYANKPLLELFTPDENGDVPARKIIRDAQQGVRDGKVAASTVKGAMQNLRYLSVQLAKKGYEGDAPDILITQNTPAAAESYFGVKEPPKAVSSLQVSSDPAKRKAFFKGLLKHAANNPDDVPAVRAILFQMSTGLRPNAVLGLTTGEYRAHENFGSLYFSGDKEGAKGNKVNVGLNSVADSQIQSQLREFPDQVKSGGRVFVRADGKPLKTTDVNRVLAQIKVPELIFDAESGKYYDSFKPSDPSATSSKFGMQLMRNYHTGVGRGIGVNDLVLAKLQGRSTKSYGKGSTGEMSTYDSSFPHEVTAYEREQAEMLADEYRRQLGEAADDLKSEGVEVRVDYGAPIKEGEVVPTRVSQATEGWTEYWDRPVETEVPAAAEVPAQPEGPKKLTDADNDSIKKKFLSLFKKAPKVGPLGIGMTAVGIAGTMSDVAEAQEISQMEDTDAASQQAAELGLSMTPGAFVQMGAETLMPSIAEDIKEEAETMTEEEFLGGFAADTFED